MSAGSFRIAQKLVPQATSMITKRITPAETMENARECAGESGFGTSLMPRLGIGYVHHTKPRLANLLFFGLAILISFAAARPAAAQESALDKGPPPPYAEPAAPPTLPVPTYDPLRADKSVEIGTFYLKRGNYDAAIERFEDATHYQPKLARPYALMGEAYEKKGDIDKAVANYKKYLEVYRSAPDREKIQKHIEKLESQSGRGQAKEKSE